MTCSARRYLGFAGRVGVAVFDVVGQPSPDQLGQGAVFGSGAGDGGGPEFIWDADRAAGFAIVHPVRVPTGGVS